MPFAASTGGRIWWEATGQGPDLLFLHGRCLSRRMWEEQVRCFAAHYRCICVDRRGHGRSDPPADGWAVVADLLAVLDAVGAQRAAVAGLSIGGWDAACLAMDAPERVAALALIDAYAPDVVQVDVPGFPAVLAALQQAGPAAATALWEQDPLFASARRQPALRERLREMLAEYTWVEQQNKVRGDRPAVPYKQRLGELQAPSLVVCGRLDTEPYRLMSEAWQARLPGADPAGVAWIENAGHLSSLEAPTAVNAALGQFLQRVWPGR